MVIKYNNLLNLISVLLQILIHGSLMRLIKMQCPDCDGQLVKLKGEDEKIGNPPLEYMKVSYYKCNKCGKIVTRETFYK